ncbi:MAG: hypothetical protein AAFR81_02180 [Chloroflexota bacterium]
MLELALTFGFSFFLLVIMPFVLFTIPLAMHARRRWAQTMDAILNGMKLDTVQDKVKRAEQHRQWALWHTIAFTIFFVGFIVWQAAFAQIQYPYSPITNLPFFSGWYCC